MATNQLDLSTNVDDDSETSAKVLSISESQSQRDVEPCRSRPDGREADRRFIDERAASFRSGQRRRTRRHSTGDVARAADRLNQQHSRLMSNESAAATGSNESNFEFGPLRSGNLAFFAGSNFHHSVTASCKSNLRAELSISDTEACYVHLVCYWQDCAQRSSSGIVFTQRSIFLFFRHAGATRCRV